MSHGGLYSTEQVRRRAVQALKRGIAVTRVAEAYGVHRATLHRWLARYNLQGVNGLARRSGSGRPRKLTELGEADFRVLEVLLHKGPMPVNSIGPKVDLNPGSVSVAVDRLYKKGFVSRIESARDRRVRTVALTEKGKKIFHPLFRRHTALIKRAFEDVSPEELQQLEGVLKKVGKRAESLAEKPRAILES